MKTKKTHAAPRKEASKRCTDDVIAEASGTLFKKALESTQAERERFWRARSV